MVKRSWASWSSAISSTGPLPLPLGLPFNTVATQSPLHAQSNNSIMDYFESHHGFTDGWCESAVGNGKRTIVDEDSDWAVSFRTTCVGCVSCCSPDIACCLFIIGAGRLPDWNNHSWCRRLVAMHCALLSSLRYTMIHVDVTKHCRAASHCSLLHHD